MDQINIIPLPFYSSVPIDLQNFIQKEILPQYDNFDPAHRRDHAISVITESMQMASFYEVKPAMVYTTAACHDLGLCEGREHHHEASARIIREMSSLHRWFSDDDINIMAEAAEDHRASTPEPPRSIYGKIVAEADRLIDVKLVILRTIQYSISHYPELNKEEHYQRTLQHLKEKYAEGGYLKLWIPESANVQRLRELRKVIAQPEELRNWFEKLYTEASKV